MRRATDPGDPNAPSPVGDDDGFAEFARSITIEFADYDRIEQSPDGATFTEEGYLPVRGFSFAGRSVTPDGLDDPSGEGWGAYMRITGGGTPTISPDGTRGASYDRLDYEIVAFKGLATYGFDADGDVVVGGAISDPVTLLTGSLISGNVAFVPTSPTDLTIEGSVSVTVEGAAPWLPEDRLGTLDLSIIHPPEDYSFTSPTVTRVAAESGTTGTFTLAADASDPALLLGALVTGDPLTV